MCCIFTFALLIERNGLIYISSDVHDYEDAPELVIRVYTLITHVSHVPIIFNNSLDLFMAKFN